MQQIVDTSIASLETGKEGFTRENLLQDFEHLRGTRHIDNEDGLEYEIIEIRRDRSRYGCSIVVDRKCSSGGAIDTVYALDTKAMTDASPKHGHKAAQTPSLQLVSVPEQVASVSTGQRVLSRASETGDLLVCLCTCSSLRGLTRIPRRDRGQLNNQVR